MRDSLGFSTTEDLGEEFIQSDRIVGERIHVGNGTVTIR